MKNYKYLSLIIIALSWSSCTKELPFPNVKDVPLMVVNSLFSPEDLKVHVSESCHIELKGGCTNSHITSADVRLLDNAGSLLSILVHQGDGIYIPENFNIEFDT